MHRRQPLPRLWLMTDERQGEALWTTLGRLPPGSGIVFRHYGLNPDARKTVFLRLRRIAKKKRLLVLVAGAQALAGDGRYGGQKGRPGPGLVGAPAHNVPEIRAAERSGADFLFLSPVYPTRSHPGAKALGRLRFALLARQTRLPVIALGGMNGRRARGLAGAYGWAGIDAWTD
jgi:thiamine-phosphate pyrophosphorylase